MKDFYGDVKEELPSKMPEPRGNVVRISAFFNANHYGNVVTRRSHSGIIIFMQNTPIFFFQRGRTRLKQQHLGVSLSRYVFISS